MLIIKNNSTNPFYNMASMEYVLKSFADDVFMIWRSSSSIVIGKNQNVNDVVDMDYALKNEIPIIRRISGGSSYYQDMGTINFAIICSGTSNNDCMLDIMSSPYTAPIKKVIDNLGVGERSYEASEIFINGNMYLSYSKMKYKEKILIHGAIMFSTDIDRFRKASSRKANIKSCFHKQSEIDIVTLNTIINEKVTEDDFTDMVLESVRKSFRNAKNYSLTSADDSYINSLCNEKYSSKRWNLGESFNFSHKYDKLYEYGQITAHLVVNNGIIEKVRFSGDFFSSLDISELEEKFVGIRYNFIEINRLVYRTDISKYIYDAKKEDIIKLLI